MTTRDIPTGTYSHTITCPNCAFVECHDIPKGTTIENHKRNNVCQKCGCSLSTEPTITYGGTPWPPRYPEVIC